MELINIKHNLQIHCCSGQAVPGQITLCLCLNLSHVLRLRLCELPMFPFDSNAGIPGGEQKFLVHHSRHRFRTSMADLSFQNCPPIVFFINLIKESFYWLRKGKNSKIIEGNTSHTEQTTFSEVQRNKHYNQKNLTLEKSLGKHHLWSKKIMQTISLDT